ncbi:alpha/beta hydrolase [Sediminibacter sp. Hel_I_10]|uniref:alpha/beta hydrolase n=1 Tax=Sediminibacter sp. Hel_I_10 TaxID=1392490 RepID=UPI00047D4F76|nr:alpha/beta hydrolase [Sediminibacter sp. Hel_I_10]
MRLKNSICLGFFLLFVMATYAMQNIKKDTSYTVNSSYKKYKKEFPQIEIVKSKQFENVTEIENLAYKTLKSRSLCLDAFINSTAANPAVIMVHGGGWKSGDKSHMKPLAQYIANKGYSCFTVEYRLSDEAIYPNGIYDVKQAIKYIKANAKQFHVDTSKVAVLGASSGAQMATLVGATNNNSKFEERSGDGISSSVQAIINLDGVLAFKHPESSEGKMASWWLGGTYDENPENWQQASALTHTNKHTPPILFINSQYNRFHAGRDDMIKIMDAYSIYSRVETFPNSPHTFWLFHPYFNTTLEYITQFLDKTLKNQ